MRDAREREYERETEEEVLFTEMQRDKSNNVVRRIRFLYEYIYLHEKCGRSVVRIICNSNEVEKHCYFFTQIL